MSAAEAPRAVLFACTSNMIRSPMAAALMQLRFGSLVSVESVGIRPGEEMDPMAALIVDEAGAEMPKRPPRGFDALDEDAHFDLIVSLSPEAHHRALNLVPALADAAEYWPTFDPSLAEGSRDQRLEEYRMVRNGLDHRISQRFPQSPNG